jgi:hypothetical protein
MKFKWSRNRDPVQCVHDWFAFSCSAVLEAAAHEKKSEELEKTPTEEQIRLA